MSDAGVTFEMGLREYARTPVLLVLLAFLPAYVTGFFARVVPTAPVPVAVAGAGTVRVSMAAASSVLMTPMVAALLGGIAGLFLMQSARAVDGRLAVAGADVRAILLARAGVLAVAVLVASLVAVGTLSVTYVPERPGWLLVATVLAGLLYGVVGAVVGLALDRLAGVYVLMFGPMLDVFLAQSPFAAESHPIAPYLPGHYPVALAFDAAFTTGVDLSNLIGGLAYLLVAGLLAGVAFARTLRVE